MFPCLFCYICILHTYVQFSTCVLGLSISRWRNILNYMKTMYCVLAKRTLVFILAIGIFDMFSTFFQGLKNDGKECSDKNI